jgi:hypothetical protein
MAWRHSNSAVPDEGTEHTVLGVLTSRSAPLGGTQVWHEALALSAMAHTRVWQSCMHPGFCDANLALDLQVCA